MAKEDLSLVAAEESEDFVLCQSGDKNTHWPKKLQTERFFMSVARLVINVWESIMLALLLDATSCLFFPKLGNEIVLPCQVFQSSFIFQVRKTRVNLKTYRHYESTAKNISSSATKQLLQIAFVNATNNFLAPYVTYSYFLITLSGKSAP